MSEQNTQDAAQAAPSVNLADLPIAEYLEAIDGGFDDSSTVADVPAFEQAVTTIVETMPEAEKASKAVDKAVGVQSALRTIIASAIIAVRASIIIRSAKGDYPDTFGTSKAYRELYEDRIVGEVLKANPKMDRPWIATELKAVRTGYLNESGTRAKGMVFEAIIRDAVASGQVPGAEVQADGKVTIPLLTQKGEPKMVPLKNEQGVVAKDAEGKTIQQQAVAVYAPGQLKDVPAILKPIVQSAIKQRDRTDKEGRPLTKVPARFGGSAKNTGGGGDKAEEPRNWSEELSASLDTISGAFGHTATMFQVQAFDKASSDLCDSLIVQKDAKGKTIHVTNPGEHAAILLRIAERFTIAAAILDAKATPETLDPFRFQADDADAATGADAATNDTDAS